MVVGRSTQSSDCPEPEILAAFVDDRLEAPVRAGVIEHLGQCELCYETVAETLRCQEEERPAGEVRELRRAGWRWSPGTRVAAAAAATLAAVMVPVLWKSLPDSGDAVELPAGALARSLLDSAGAADLLAGVYDGEGWSRSRDDFSFLSGPQRGFRLGVRAVDLEMALEAREPERARRIAYELRGLAEGLPSPEPILSAYDQLTADLDADLELGALQQQSAALDEALAAADPPSYALGKWAESGLLAAAAEAPEHFRRPVVQRFFRRLEARDLAAEWAPLASLSQQLRSEAGELDFPRLARAFRDFVEAGGGKA